MQALRTIGEMAGYPSVTRFRRVLFRVAVVLFFLTWPILLMRMFGLRVDAEEERLVATGAVWVVSRPDGARITVGGDDSGETTPALVRDLDPGEHALRLELDGYRPWTAEVTVRAEQVVELDAALLMPDSPAMVSLPDAGSAEAEIVLLPEHLLLVERELSAWVAYDLRQDDPQPFSFTVPASSEATERSEAGNGATDAPRIVERVDVVPSRDRVGAWLKIGDERRFVLVEPGRTALEHRTLEASVPDGALLLWHAPVLDITYFLADGMLYAYRAALAETAIVEEEIAGWGYLDGSLLLLFADGRVTAMSGVGVRTDELDPAELSPELAAELRRFIREARAGDRLEVVYADDGSLALMRSDGRLLIIHAGRSRTMPAAGAAADSREERLLIWQANRLGSVVLHAEDADGELLRVAWHRSDSTAPRDVIPIPEIAHALYRDGERLMSVLVAPGVDAPPVTVLDAEPGESVRLSPETGMLVVRNGQAGRLRLMELVPPEPILTMERLE